MSKVIADINIVLIIFYVGGSVRNLRIGRASEKTLFAFITYMALGNQLILSNSPKINNIVMHLQ